MSTNGYYQVHIRSWENDGDHYQTHIVDAFNPTDVKFYVALAQKFKSSNRPTGGYGNDGVPNETLIEMFEELMGEYSAGMTRGVVSAWTPEVDPEYIEEDDLELKGDFYYQQLVDLILGMADEFYMCEYENFCRVVDSIKVFWVPEAIVEVTKDFV